MVKKPCNWTTHARENHAQYRGCNADARNRAATGQAGDGSIEQFGERGSGELEGGPRTMLNTRTKVTAGMDGVRR